MIVSGPVIGKFLSVKRLDGLVICRQGWRKTSSSKFLAAWKRWRIVHKGRTLLPRNLLNQWIHLIPYRIKTYSIILKIIILTSSPNSSEKTKKLF